MIRLRLLTVLSLVFLVVAPALAQNRPERPNFVIINVDDLGYADIGPFGSKLNRTPNLDRMAEQGRKLSSFYAAPVCSPSRSSLMTGCYPKRALPIPGVLFPAAAVGLNPNEITIAEVLREQGYRTACIGKWHLGDQPEFLPTQQGFEYYLGIPYSNDMGLAAEGSKSDLGKPLPDARKNSPSSALITRHGADETGLKANQQPPLPLLENTKVVARVKQAEQQAIVETYTTAAVKFIESHSSEPFFLYLPHSAVHFPLYPGKDWAGKSPHGYYSDWVEEVDWSVGRVLDTIRQLGIEEKTLVIFTSDNGGTPRAVNLPLRGNKGSTWEGGMRVPTIAWWPSQIAGATESHDITGMIDVLPTLAYLAGAKLVSNHQLDGMNIWPVLAGTPAAVGHDHFYYFRGLRLEAVRSGVWKLHLGVNKPNQKQPKPSEAAGSVDQLYNLETDIGEKQNVIDAHPDVVQRLRDLANAMDQDLGIDAIGPGCRPLGRVVNPAPWIDHAGTFRVLAP
ncbi:MAG: sulfatase [Pirellulaceae bacterium]